MQRNEENETQNINGTSTMHQEQISEEYDNNGDSNPTPNRGIIVDERSDEQVSRTQHVNYSNGFFNYIWTISVTFQ